MSRGGRCRVYSALHINQGAPMKRFLPAALASVLLAVLGGCGGGGSDVAMPAPPATSVQITNTNQTTVARAVVSGGFALTLAQPLAAPGRATALAAGSPGSAAAPADVLHAVLQRTLQRIAPGLRAAAGPRKLQPLAVSTESELCDLSGSITTAFDDRDGNNVPSAGDVATVTFADCEFSASERVDGVVVVSVTSLASNTTTLLAFDGSMAFQRVDATFGETVAGVDGSFAFSYVQDNAKLQIAITVGATALQVDAIAPGYSDSITYASGTRIDMIDTNTVPIATTFAIDGTFSATSIGGAVDIATLEPVRQLETEAYPSSGQMLATGAGGSQLRITVIDDTQVRLDLDANGDGMFEASTLLPWTALAPE